MAQNPFVAFGLIWGRDLGSQGESSRFSSVPSSEGFKGFELQLVLLLLFTFFFVCFVI